jgi:adenosylcobinamide-phosphate synthase
MVTKVEEKKPFTVLVTEDLVIVRLRNASSYTVLSSAVLNGGLFTTCSTSSSASLSGLNVLNTKVPSDYDGIHPDPDELLRHIAKQNDLDPSNTIGLMTAASMQTLRISSRTADGVSVDVLVTAGMSNARAAGADADFFGLGKENQKVRPAPGTINTVVITNADLSKSALVEGHAIAIEAKCAACAEMGICCVKSGALAQGTGTDATVLISQPPANGTARHIPYAGKHTLFAELLAQAVQEATREALLTNIHYIYGSRWRYALHNYRLALGGLVQGARPCIPPAPMMPVPSAPFSIKATGSLLVLLVYILPLPRAARVVLAATVWDRYLPSLPLLIHPVVLVGRLITNALNILPKQVFVSPTLGFVAGCGLFASVLGTALLAAGLLLHVAAPMATATMVQQIAMQYPGQEATSQRVLAEFGGWILEILLVNSSCNLQLLCTLALQMARFLERRQIPQARAQLSWLCSRDPSKLTAAELAAGTLESLAENLSDSFVAPLFWYIWLGPLGCLGYRVMNTLDSRVGYHGKFEWVGKPSARLDDLVNLVPARLTAIFLVVAATVVQGCDAGNGWSAAWKDCSQCESPNAGWPMAAMAGLLGVILEKKGEYRLGNSITVAQKEALPSPSSMRRGHKVAQLAGCLAAAMAAFVICMRGE